jgi:predicted nucleic acid-binding protein
MLGECDTSYKGDAAPNQPNPDPSLLAIVLTRVGTNKKEASKHLFRLGEVESVFPDVRAVLGFIPVKRPNKEVVAWLDGQPRTSIWTTSITILEVRLGLQIMTSGKRRSALMQAFEGVLDKIGYRVAAFDATAAQEASDLMASRHKRGALASCAIR